MGRKDSIFLLKGKKQRQDKHHDYTHDYLKGQTDLDIVHERVLARGHHQGVGRS